MQDGRELGWYFSVLRRWLWLIVICTLLGAAAAFLVSSRMTPVYSASTTLLVDQASGTGRSDYNAILGSERLARTYSEMLSGRPVLEATIAGLDLAETPRQLARRINVKSVRDTQLIQVRAEDADPTRAALIADTVAAAFIAQNEARQAGRYAGSLASTQAQISELSGLIEETQAAIDALGTPGQDQEAELARLESVLAGYRGTYATLQQNYEQMRLTAALSTDNVTVIETAPVPKSPVRPRTLLNTALAGVVGATLALGLAFLLEVLDDTIKTSYDVRQTLDLDMLGAIGRLGKGEQELVVADKPSSPVAEAFHVLSTNVRFSNGNSPPRTLLVTSPRFGEGKSITTANLALAMSQAGLSVVAVDADLRRPRLHRLFGFHPRRKGLSRVLLNGSTNGRLQLAHVEGLRFLPDGARPPNLAEMLESQDMQGLLNELARRVDVVLIDSPPVLSVADAALLAGRVDGVLLVLQAGHTRREDARHAEQSLRQVGANLLGVALNAVPAPAGNHTSYQGFSENGGQNASVAPVQRLLK